LFVGSSLANGYEAIDKKRAIKRVDRLPCLIDTGHFYIAASFELTGNRIGDQMHSGDGSGHGEQSLDISRRNSEGDVSDIQFSGHGIAPNCEQQRRVVKESSISGVSDPGVAGWYPQ
jgi:hypothetical protein